MKGWSRRLRGALVISGIWALAWGSVGMLIEWIHNIWPNPLGRLVDIWPMALALPAFLSGLFFSTLLGIAGRRRKFSELSVGRFVVLGAAGGLLVGLVPAVMVLVGFGDLKAPYTLPYLIATISGPFAVVGALTGAGTLLIARTGERGALPPGEKHLLEE